MDVQLNKNVKVQIIMQKLAGIEQAWYSHQVDVAVAKACEDARLEESAKDAMRSLQRKKDALNDMLLELEEEGDDESAD